MPMSRRWAGTLIRRSSENMVLPSMEMVPPVGRSNPARARNVVVLPQPDGPSSVKNSPSAMLKLTPRTACTLPSSVW
jgi:hypothetical protein